MSQTTGNVMTPWRWQEQETFLPDYRKKSNPHETGLTIVLLDVIPALVRKGWSPKCLVSTTIPLMLTGVVGFALLLCLCQRSVRQAGAGRAFNQPVSYLGWAHNQRCAMAITVANGSMCLRLRTDDIREFVNFQTYFSRF
jgi:hypothetical protein